MCPDTGTIQLPSGAVKGPYLRCTLRPGTLEDFLEGLATVTGTGLAYAPDDAFWFTVDNGRTSWFSLEEGTLSDGLASRPGIYEVRVFNQDTEHRWIHDTGGRGETYILQDTDVPGPLYRLTAAGRPVTEDWLLWGLDTTPDTPLPPGWSVTAAARVGARPLPVDPYPGPGRARPHLRMALYVAEDAHGNVSVQAERPLGLGWKAEDR